MTTPVIQTLRTNYRSRNLSIENARHDIKTPTAAIIQEAKEMGLISNGTTGPTGSIGLQGVIGPQGFQGSAGGGGDNRLSSATGSSTSIVLSATDPQYIFVIGDIPAVKIFTLPSASGNNGLAFTFITYIPDSISFQANYRIRTQNSERIFSINNAPIEPPTDPIQTPVLNYNTKIVAFNGDWYLVYNDDPL
jgi:hypothetical protein